MANAINKSAKSVRGINPMLLIEKITRAKILDCEFWKERCFGLNGLIFSLNFIHYLIFYYYIKKEESIAGEAAKLTEIGGNYGGNVMPTPFLCLLLKMLQLQPDPDIIKLYISQETSKLVFF